MTETASAQADRYVMDARASRLTIQAFAGGFLSAMGHNPVIGARDISAEVRFSPETLDVTGLRLRIPTAGLSVQNNVSDKDRREIEQTMRDQVLETAKYPEILFEGAAVRAREVAEGRFHVELDGDLTLHGVTRPQHLPVQVFSMGDTLRAQGAFEIRQTDFDIRLVSVAGGALKIKDELKCSFDLLVRKAT